MENRPLARVLSDVYAGIVFERFSTETVDFAKVCILDQIGVQIAGAVLPWIGPYRRLVAGVAGSGASTVVGSPNKISSTYASFINSVSGHSCEFDDLMMVGGGHPGSVIVPAALATAEQVGADGRDFMTAVIAGYDAMCRITDCIHPRHLQRGFQSTALTGPFGAAVASGLLLGLDSDQMTNALGIAGSYCTGLTEYDQQGGESKRIFSAIASRGGIESAVAAAEGLTAPPTILEGGKGFFKSFIGEVDPQPLFDELGHDFRIVPWLKYYPCTLAVHSSIDAFSFVMKENGLADDDIMSVQVFVSPTVQHHAGTITRPTDVIGAQFSLHFSLALRGVTGRNDLKSYCSPQMLSDPRIISLIDRIEVVPSEEIKRHFPSRVLVETRDGRRFEHTQEYAKGSPKNPLSPAEIEDKFDSLVDGIVARASARRIKEQIWSLEKPGQISHLARELSFLAPLA